MKVAIRVDASSQMGTGHFMRCLTLADALKHRRASVRFVSRHLPAHLRGMALAAGHQVTLLEGSSDQAIAGDLAHAHWLGTSQSADAQASIEALLDMLPDWLIVDHYALDARWETSLRSVAKNVFVIDDIADRHHDCDILLDQNCLEGMEVLYAGKVPSHCRLLFGPRFALLRDEFRQVHAKIKPRDGQVSRILVFFGGMDSDNYTGRILAILPDIGIDGIHVDVVIGELHPNRQQIESACLAHDFECHVQTSRMAELMAAADLAIGAGGSATWERCCLGLPTLAICTACNQVRQIDSAASEFLLYASDMCSDLTIGIKRHLSALLENSMLRGAMSRRAIRAVDGRGVSRVIGHLGCSCIKVRRAVQDDSSKLFEWRNHPTIRAVSRNARAIAWEDHQEWFASVVTDQNTVLLIGEIDEVAIGSVRFDLKNNEAEVSIYLVPGMQGQGLGRDLLERAEGWLVSYRAEIRSIRACVLAANEPSRRLFDRAGYFVESTWVKKRLANHDQ